MLAARSSPRTIGRAAREAGVHVETIRYYERLGLIARPRTSGGYRVYPDEAVHRLAALRNEPARLINASPRKGPYANCKVCENLALS